MGRRYEALMRRSGTGRFAHVVNWNTAAAPRKEVVIPASVVHADPKKFWNERLTWGHTRCRATRIPLWDRMAHVALMVSRPTEGPDTPADAFRRLFDSWKAFFITKIALTKTLLLPQVTTSVVDTLARERDEAKKGGGKGEETSGDSDTKK